MKTAPEVRLFRGGELLHTATIDERPLVIGETGQCDLIVQSPRPPRALLWLEGGQLWIRDLDGPARLFINGVSVGEPAVLGAEQTVWLGPDIELKVSTDDAERCFPYRMAIAQRGSLGMEITISDLSSRKSCLIRSQNRTAMLYLLAQQFEKDAAANLPLADRGWCSDEAIACGVWGRHWKERMETHLYVLLHRVRKKVESGGLDPGCIEKKRRHVRAWVQEVVFS